jgi:hypothetical protein
MKFALTALMIVTIFLNTGIANSGKCLDVKLDGDFGISIDCWKIEGKSYDVTFEFSTYIHQLIGALYWNLKTMTERSDCKCDYAPVSRSGATTSYELGDDGYLQKGILWTSPRFIDHSNGTVTDTLTWLKWLKNADCFGKQTWSNALSLANNLKDGDCGLTDGSVPGVWRLPNIKELLSLINYDYIYPALSDATGFYQMGEGDPFSNLPDNDEYWTSTTFYGGPGENHGTFAYFVNMGTAYVWWNGKTVPCHVWPVWGGDETR